MNKSSFINISDGVINSDEVDPDDEDESDEEHDLDVTDAKSEEEPMEQESEDHSFLKSMMESFVEKVSFLKSRAGRAGLVHNFLRGLQIMTAPIPFWYVNVFYRSFTVTWCICLPMFTRDVNRKLFDSNNAPFDTLISINKEKR